MGKVPGPDIPPCFMPWNESAKPWALGRPQCCGEALTCARSEEAAVLPYHLTAALPMLSTPPGTSEVLETAVRLKDGCPKESSLSNTIIQNFPSLTSKADVPRFSCQALWIRNTMAIHFRGPPPVHHPLNTGIHGSLMLEMPLPHSRGKETLLPCLPGCVP